MWLNGVVVSAPGIRTWGPGFESRVAPLFHWVATLGKVFRCFAGGVRWITSRGADAGPVRRWVRAPSPRSASTTSQAVNCVSICRAWPTSASSVQQSYRASSSSTACTMSRHSARSSTASSAYTTRPGATSPQRLYSLAAAVLTPGILYGF